MKLQLHQQWHSKMADRTPSRWQQCETRRSPESLPSGMVLFSISFCFSSGSAGKAAQRGERGGREKQKTMRRSKKYFSVERGLKSKREEIWGYQRLTGRIKKHRQQENCWQSSKIAASPHYPAAAAATQETEWLCVCFSLLIGSQSFPF